MDTVIAKNQSHRVSSCWVVSIVPGSPVSNLLALSARLPTRLNTANRGPRVGSVAPSVFSAAGRLLGQVRLIERVFGIAA